MNETYSRSSLGELRSDSSVNLERAMAAGGRFGGHMVSGHIDGTGRIKATRRDGNAVWYEITAEHALLEGIVEKGSITIDGISLTVAKVTTSSFSVSIIPHTLEQTILKDKRPGSVVNLETDMIGKYVRAFLSQSGEKRDFWEVMYG
jgi:riboflavin synthase